MPKNNEKVLSEIRERHPDADLYIHCGDSEVMPDKIKDYITVQGNADYPGLYPGGKKIKIGSHAILVKHGHDMFGSYPHSKYLAKIAKEHGCDILLYGHSHVFCDEVADGVFIINPGSITNPKYGGDPSYAEIVLTDTDIIVKKIIYPNKC